MIVEEYTVYVCEQHCLFITNKTSKHICIRNYDIYKFKKKKKQNVSKENNNERGTTYRFVIFSFARGWHMLTMNIFFPLLRTTANPTSIFNAHQMTDPFQFQRVLQRELIIQSSFWGLSLYHVPSTVRRERKRRVKLVMSTKINAVFRYIIMKATFLWITK